MNDSNVYTLENWKDPEILFSEVYDPFDLLRDMNKGRDECFFNFERGLISQVDDVNAESNFDEEKEDVKCNVYATTQGIGNVETVSELDRHIDEEMEGNKYVRIPHFDINGPTIKVTKVRKERILKQREKRRAFLKNISRVRLAIQTKKQRYQV